MFVPYPTICTLKGWTTVHSYFTIMGGFDGWDKSLSKMSSLDVGLYPEMFGRDGAAHNTIMEGTPLPAPSVPPTDERNLSEFQIRVTISEIWDKGKRNPVARLFTLLQTTWFIAQYLSRWRAHQPRTQLELMTLAYTILNCYILSLWWEKPLNAEKPIDVRGRAGAIEECRRNSACPAWLRCFIQSRACLWPPTPCHSKTTNCVCRALLCYFIRSGAFEVRCHGSVGWWGRLGWSSLSCMVVIFSNCRRAGAMESLCSCLYCLPSAIRNKVRHWSTA